MQAAPKFKEEEAEAGFGLKQLIALADRNKVAVLGAAVVLAAGAVALQQSGALAAIGAQLEVREGGACACGWC